MTEKPCIRCGETKPIEEYYVHSGMADGRLNKCKACCRACVRERYEAKREEIAAYERTRAQTPHRKAKAGDYQLQYRERHPDKIRARTAVGNAVRDGRLVRLPCEVCGEPNSEAHHGDYSKPLDVRWFCFKHHREEAHGQTVNEATRHHPKLVPF